MAQTGQMPQIGQMPQNIQQRSVNNLKELIFNNLSQQPIPAGWQSTYSQEERASQIWLM